MAKLKNGRWTLARAVKAGALGEFECDEDRGTGDPLFPDECAALARMRRSCAPNTVLLLTGEKRATLFATRALAKDTELTRAYVHPQTLYFTLDCRRQLFRYLELPSCGCASCGSGESMEKRKNNQWLLELMALRGSKPSLRRILDCLQELEEAPRTSTTQAWTVDLIFLLASKVVELQGVASEKQRCEEDVIHYLRFGLGYFQAVTQAGFVFFLASILLNTNGPWVQQQDEYAQWLRVAALPSGLRAKLVQPDAFVFANSAAQGELVMRVPLPDFVSTCDEPNIFCVATPLGKATLPAFPHSCDPSAFPVFRLNLNNQCEILLYATRRCSANQPITLAHPDITPLTPRWVRAVVLFDSRILCSCPLCASDDAPFQAAKGICAEAHGNLHESFAASLTSAKPLAKARMLCMLLRFAQLLLSSRLVTPCILSRPSLFYSPDLFF